LGGGVGNQHRPAIKALAQPRRGKGRIHGVNKVEKGETDHQNRRYSWSKPDSEEFSKKLGGGGGGWVGGEKKGKKKLKSLRKKSTSTRAKKTKIGEAKK